MRLSSSSLSLPPAHDIGPRFDRRRFFFLPCTCVSSPSLSLSRCTPHSSNRSSSALCLLNFCKNGRKSPPLARRRFWHQHCCAESVLFAKQKKIAERKKNANGNDHQHQHTTCARMTRTCTHPHPSRQRFYVQIVNKTDRSQRNQHQRAKLLSPPQQMRERKRFQ